MVEVVDYQSIKPALDALPTSGLPAGKPSIPSPDPATLPQGASLGGRPPTPTSPAGSVFASLAVPPPKPVNGRANPLLSLATTAPQLSVAAVLNEPEGIIEEFKGLLPLLRSQVLEPFLTGIEHHVELLDGGFIIELYILIGQGRAGLRRRCASAQAGPVRMVPGATIVC